MKRKKILYLSAVILILILIIIAIVFKNNLENQKSRIPYILTKGVFEDAVISTGELSSETFIKIQAPAEELRANGIYEISIASLLSEGTIIDSGTVVAELDQSKILEKLDDNEKLLQNAENEYQNTKLDTSMDLSSVRDQILNNKYNVEELNLALIQSKYESPAVIKQAENNLEKAKRELNQAIKNYDLKIQKSAGTVFQKTLEVQKYKNKKKKILELEKKLIISSPSHGMLVYYKGIDGKLIQTGSVIQLWRDGIVATIPNFSSMISSTYINEIEISKVKKGQTVKIGIDAFPDKSFLGKVVYIANIGEQLPNSDAKVFNVQIKLNNTDSVLRPGMTTSNKIIITSLNNVLLLPIEAVHSKRDINYVYIHKGLFAFKRKVELGNYNESYYVVKKGLKVGDEVYLSMLENDQGKSGAIGNSKQDSIDNK